jgi:hypothetical protein
MTDIYHITHIDNLSSIVKDGGLWCDNEGRRQHSSSVGIAYEDLKERRRRTPVRVAAGGVLGDYVPFYFANRSHMLYTITRGNVPGVRVNQRDIVYLVSSVERVSQEDCDWCFTDGHAVEGFSNFYTALSDLARIDWQIIQSWSWRNTEIDPDRKRKNRPNF